MKVSRQALLDVAKEHDLKTSAKGKPLSNAKLLKLIQDNIDDMMVDGRTDSTVIAALSTAFDEEEEVTVTGDDPTVPKKAEAPAKKSDKGKKAGKSKKPAAEEEDEEEEKPAKGKKKSGKKSDDDEKPAKAKKKKESSRDKWGSNPVSSAGRINSVLFTAKGKGMTLDDIMEALDDESITRTRVRDHLRRICTDELCNLDEKGRYKPASAKKDE
jgi:hypothetical protein